MTDPRQRPGKGRKDDPNLGQKRLIERRPNPKRKRIMKKATIRTWARRKLTKKTLNWTRKKARRL
jgi:hypothetical protein